MSNLSRAARRAGAAAAALAFVTLWLAGRAQAPEEAVPSRAAADSDAAWELPPDLLDALARQAEAYKEHALRFTCRENARIARYDDSNEASSETVERYAYLLERDRDGEALREYRELLKKKGKTEDGAPKYEPSGKEVEEAPRFPPAFAWVFLFSRFHQPFFMYRVVGDRFEGFDWVHEIQFRGALPFAQGNDIREWEGTALVDAVTLLPIEIRAEPTAQRERIRVLFERWNQAFNLLGAHLAPRPFGYRCRVHFGVRKNRLSFPTELRYDTFRAMGPKKFAPWMASVRTYEDYRFFKTSTTETPPSPVPR